MHIKKLLFFLLLIIISTISCMQSHSNPITLKLKVDPEAGKCKLDLIVTESADEDIILNFSSSKKYDFIVKDPKGKIIWQWSEGKVFAQMLQDLKITSGESITFTEIWPYTDKNIGTIQPGIYIVQGILTTIPNPIKTDWKEVEITSSHIETQVHIEGRVRKILNKLYFLGEDGIAYHIENPGDDLYEQINSNIVVTSYVVKPIPGTIDKKIIIEEYELK